MGKKINELTTATDINNGSLLFIGDPTTGSLKKVSLDELSKNINTISLEAGRPSYTATENFDIRTIKIKGGTETLIGVGTSDETDDIYDTGHLPENGTLFFDGLRQIHNGQTIHFNGVQEDTLITIYKL
jgi:ATP phosphoribosyltransferase